MSGLICVAARQAARRLIGYTSDAATTSGVMCVRGNRFPGCRARHDLHHFGHPCGRARQNVHECGKVFGVQMDGGVLHQHETSLPGYTLSLTPDRDGQDRKRMQDRSENLCLSRLPDMNRLASATADVLNYVNLTAAQRDRRPACLDRYWHTQTSQTCSAHTVIRRRSGPGRGAIAPFRHSSTTIITRPLR